MRCVLACESDATKSTAQICTISKNFNTYVGNFLCWAGRFSKWIQQNIKYIYLKGRIRGLSAG